MQNRLLRADAPRSTLETPRSALPRSTSQVMARPRPTAASALLLAVVLSLPVLVLTTAAQLLF